MILSPANAPEPSFSKRHLNPLIPLELIVMSPDFVVNPEFVCIPLKIAFSLKFQPAIKLSEPAENTFSLFLYPIRP